MKNPARIAFISTAHIHARGFIEHALSRPDDIVVDAVWDDVPQRGQTHATLASARFEPDLDRLLENPDIDAFAICVQNTKHLELLARVIPVGKPIFCDKPLATTVTDLNAIRQLLEASPVPPPLFCGYFQPHEPAMTGVAQLLASGALGDVKRIRCRSAHHAAYGRWFDSPDLAWFTDPNLSGGGGFMDMGSHAVHLARTLFGPVTRVWASIRNESGIYPEVDDYGIAHLEFASGVSGVVEGGWTQTRPVREIEIVGSAATAWQNGDHMVFGAPGKDAQRVPLGESKPTRMDRLIAVIRGEIPSDELAADLAATTDTVAIMEACYTSAHSCKWTPVAI